MRGKSHQCLGQYLVQHYMSNQPERHKRAFLLGCIEPDRNPATYLKGSLRYQWLRGHNYKNARGFMRRVSQRLENRSKMNILDYYTLGKLIHYTADAFTSAHNDTFSSNLNDHREYEAAMQDHFLSYMQEDPSVDPEAAHSVMDAIYSYRREYKTQPTNIYTDTRFVLSACCCVLAVLFAKPIL